MSSSQTTLMETPLQLPPERRAALAEWLLDTIQEPIEPSADLEAAWAQEAENRIAAYGRGEIESEDGESILRDLRAGKRP